MLILSVNGVFKLRVQEPTSGSMDNNAGHYIKNLKHSSQFFFYWDI